MKLITALGAACLVALATAATVRAAGPTPTVSVAAITCVTVGATWVDNQQVTPAITVCAPTP